jgi:hypothetical protein
MKFLLMTLLTLHFATSAHAEDFDGGFMISGSMIDVPQGMTTQRLATLKSDKNNNTNYLHVLINSDHKVAGMFNEDAPGNVKDGTDTRSNGVFLLKEIETQNGVVLKRASNRDVMFLSGKLDQASQEGKFTIKYLSNGLWGSYKSCDFFLRRAPGTDGWLAVNAYNGKPITDIFVETWSLGIETVHGVCPE